MAEVDLENQNPLSGLPFQELIWVWWWHGGLIPLNLQWLAAVLGVSEGWPLLLTPLLILILHCPIYLRALRPGSPLPFFGIVTFIRGCPLIPFTDLHSFAQCFPFLHLGHSPGNGRWLLPDSWAFSLLSTSSLRAVTLYVACFATSKASSRIATVFTEPKYCRHQSSIGQRTS